MEKTTQEEILEQTEQEGLVEAPEQIEEEVAEETEETQEIVAEAPKAKVKEDDDEDGDDDDDDDEEEEAEEQVKKEELKIPTTKSAMVSALFDKVNGLKKEDVSKRFKDLMAVIEAEDLGGVSDSDIAAAEQIQKITSFSERGTSLFSCSGEIRACSRHGDSLINNAAGMAIIK